MIMFSDVKRDYSITILKGKFKKKILLILQLNRLNYNCLRLVIFFSLFTFLGTTGQLFGQEVLPVKRIASTIGTNFFFPQPWFLVIFLCLLTGLLMVIITREKKLKRNKLQLEAEIIQYTSQVEKGKALIAEQALQLQQINSAKTNFFTNITHEIRTPLTLILGPVEQMLSNGLPNSYKPQVRLIKKNAEYLLNTVNQLLDISKVESGSMQLNYTLGDIIAFTKEVVNRFESLASQKHQNLTFQSNIENWETCFDEEKLNKIIYNLLANALKFTPEHGQIKLTIDKRIEDQKDYIDLSVEDSGIGIAPTDITKIFDRFFQVDTGAKQEKNSTGIGLSLVKELVEFQEGDIEVNSELDKGTIFKVTLPVLSPEEELEVQEESPSTKAFLQNGKSLESTSSNRQFEILLIEDNPDMRAFIRKSIQNDTYIIREATNGVKGIKLALQYVPDLIISDIMMPLKNGYKVTKAIRSNIQTAHIPIILLTAKNNQESQLKALNEGADAYLTKPFNAKELNLRIKKLIENRALLRQRFQHNNILSENEPQKTTPFTFEVEEEFLKRLKTIIEKHIDITTLNGEFISRELGMSRMSLHRKLKSITNQSTREFIKEFRLQKAFQWLQENPEDVSQIAYQAGFSAPSYFTKLFKKRFGIVPSQMCEKKEPQQLFKQKKIELISVAP